MPLTWWHSLIRAKREVKKPLGWRSRKVELGSSICPVPGAVATLKYLLVLMSLSAATPCLTTLWHWWLCVHAVNTHIIIYVYDYICTYSIYKYILTTTPKMKIIFSNLLIKLRFREIKTLVQGHLASDWRNLIQTLPTTLYLWHCLLQIFKLIFW